MSQEVGKLKVESLIWKVYNYWNYKPRMLENISSHRSGRKVENVDPIIYDKLFFSERGNDKIKNSLYHLFKAIKKSHPKSGSGKIIRSTIIAEWLKSRISESFNTWPAIDG